MLRVSCLKKRPPKNKRGTAIIVKSTALKDVKIPFAEIIASDIITPYNIAHTGPYIAPSLAPSAKVLASGCKNAIIIPQINPAAKAPNIE